MALAVPEATPEATPEDGQPPPRRTLPAITDVGCWTLACIAAAVLLIAVRR